MNKRPKDNGLPEEPIFALELVKFTLANTTVKLQNALNVVES